MFISVADGLWFGNRGIIAAIIAFILAGFGIGWLCRKFFSFEAFQEIHPTRNFLHVMGDVWAFIIGGGL